MSADRIEALAEAVVAALWTVDDVLAEAHTESWDKRTLPKLIRAIREAAALPPPPPPPEPPAPKPLPPLDVANKERHQEWLTEREARREERNRPKPTGVACPTCGTELLRSVRDKARQEIKANWWTKEVPEDSAAVECPKEGCGFEGRLRHVYHRSDYF